MFALQKAVNNQLNVMMRFRKLISKATLVSQSVTLSLCQIRLADHKWSSNRGHLKLDCIRP